MVLVVDAARVVLDDDRSGLDGDRDHRGDLGLLAGIERVVDQLLEHDERPVVDRVPGLVLQFPPGAELHQPRDPEGDARQLRLGLSCERPAWALPQFVKTESPVVGFLAC